MRTRNLAAVVTVAVTLGIGSSGSAWAVDATDYVEAITVNTTDIANAAVAASLQNAGNPDITCGNPFAEGTFVTPATDAHPAGTVDGNDIGTGNGECLSLQGGSFSVTLKTQIEYLPKHLTKFQIIPGCIGSSSATAISGVGPVAVPEVACNYTATSPYAGQPHRVHSILTNTLNTNVYEGFSHVFNGGVGVTVTVGS